MPSKHARSDPEAFWLRPVMASVQPELGRIVYAGSDFLHPFQLHFSKEGMDHIVQNWLRSDLDGVVRFWPTAFGLLLAHYQFPTFRLGSSADVLENTVQNQPGSNLVPADCVRFWPNGSGPEASPVCQIIQPASGQCFPADPDRMQIGSGTFTGWICTA